MGERFGGGAWMVVLGTVGAVYHRTLVQDQPPIHLWPQDLGGTAH